MVKLNGLSEVNNPYMNMTIDDIKRLPESEYRQYMVFCTTLMSRDIRQIKCAIKDRPEITRANLSLLFSGITMLILGITAVIMVWQ
jgi:hypothetical protein